MSMSLRDQLIQAGLGTKKQAKEAEQAQRRPPSRHQPAPASATKVAADKAAAAKAARDLELNRRQQEKAAAKARRAEARQLIEQHRLPPVDTEEFYNFTDENRIARLRVTPAMREQLIKGTLAIARYNGHYAVIPATEVERIRERDEHAVIPTAAAPETKAPSQDDPYKDFVVPDDLMW